MKGQEGFQGVSLWLGTKARVSSEVLKFTINVFWFWSWGSAHRRFRTPPSSVTTHWVRTCHENILIANVISNEAAGRESRIHVFPLSLVQTESNRYFFKELKLMAPLPERQTAPYSWDCPSTNTPGHTLRASLFTFHTSSLAKDQS